MLVFYFVVWTLSSSPPKSLHHVLIPCDFLVWYFKYHQISKRVWRLLHPPDMSSRVSVWTCWICPGRVESTHAPTHGRVESPPEGTKLVQSTPCPSQLSCRWQTHTRFHFPAFCTVYFSPCLFHYLTSFVSEVKWGPMLPEHWIKNSDWNTAALRFPSRKCYLLLNSRLMREQPVNNLQPSVQPTAT